MKKYGIDNVWGLYNKINLTKEQQKLLDQEILTENNKCYSCKSLEHYKK